MKIDVTLQIPAALLYAKAEIKTLVRNAARAQIYDEFRGRIGDIITGTVLPVYS